MSESEQRHAHQCVSCGINIADMSTATFKCLDCGQETSCCSKCCKQNNLYEYPDYGSMDP